MRALVLFVGLLLSAGTLRAQGVLGGPEYGFELTFPKTWEVGGKDPLTADPPCMYIHGGWDRGVSHSKIGLYCYLEAADAFDVYEQIRKDLREVVCYGEDFDCVFSEELPGLVELRGKKVWVWGWSVVGGIRDLQINEYVWKEDGLWVRLRKTCDGDPCSANEIFKDIKWLK